MERNEAPNDVDPLPPAVVEETTSALKRLGPMQFTGGTFPLMGFFASAYEHIAAQAAVMLADWKNNSNKQD